MTHSRGRLGDSRTSSENVNTKASSMYTAQYFMSPTRTELLAGLATMVCLPGYILIFASCDWKLCIASTMVMRLCWDDKGCRNSNQK